MEVTLYSLPNCLGCRHMKALLNRANVTWSEVVIGVDITKIDFDAQHPGVTQTPYVIMDGVGYPNIIKFARKLLEKGLVQAPEK